MEVKQLRYKYYRLYQHALLHKEKDKSSCDVGKSSGTSKILSSHDHGYRSHVDESDATVPTHVIHDLDAHALTTHALVTPAPIAPHGFPRGTKDTSLLPLCANHVASCIEVEQIFTNAFKNLIYDNYTN